MKTKLNDVETPSYLRKYILLTVNTKLYLRTKPLKMKKG